MAPAADELGSVTGAACSLAALPITLLRAARPRQWTKNVLVFAAPATASQLAHAGAVGRTFEALAILVAASSATYLVNDVLDAPADRLHPTKRHRPVASGLLPVPAALACAGLLLAGAIAGASAVSRPLLEVVVVYLTVTLTYSFGIKDVPVVELAFVSAGFVLRAAAGGAATHVSISPWFLIVTSAGALLVVAGKRSAELSALGSRSSAHRAALEAYPPAVLRSARILAVSVAVTAYCLWVFERASHIVPPRRSDNLVFFELSVIPFVLALLVTELALESGRGGAPEDLALKDRTLQVLGVAWIALIVLGVYA